MINLMEVDIMNNPILYFENLIENEEWLPITEVAVPDIQPYYAISNKGRVYSYMLQSLLKPNQTGNGYMQVRLFLKDGSYVGVGIHRLVMITFCFRPDFINLEVNHKDGNKANNELSNLEWMTHKSNIIHAYDNDLMHKGENHCNATHSETLVRKICECLEKRLPYNEIMKICDMEISDISI